MDQLTVFRLFLFLHVMGAIVAFGPGFAAAIGGAMVAREPQHGNFFARTQVAIGTRLVGPAALSMAVTGVIMIAVLGWSAIVGSKLWLPVAIVLYVIAIVYSFAVQAPTGRRLVELTETPPAPGSPPPPELPATARRVRTGGIVLSTLVVIIVFLMVVKPF
jgi:Predicted integral membrane protein (DUF2269)